MPLLVHIMRISLLAICITNIIQPIECFSTPSKLSTSFSYHHQQHQHQLRLLSRYQTTTRISGGGGGTCLKSTTEEEATTTSQDGSIVYYDDFLDPDNPMGVVCARGVCVLPDDD